MKQSMLVLVPAIVAFVAAPALAGHDERACEGKAEGDACQERDGEEGVCRVDRDDNVLECEGTDRGDKLACAELSQGDACTQTDGDKGTCQPDDGTDVLECED